MNLVQSMIAARLRMGFTQAELARELGICRAALCLVIAGRREASAKVLEYLGIDRTVTYTLRADAPTIGRPLRKPQTARQAQRSRRAVTRKAAAGAVPVHAAQVEAIAPAQATAPALAMSTADVLIAVRHRVNPGQTWASWCASDRSLDWPSWCAQHGTMPAQVEPVKQAPRELYDHLRPIDRRQDHRRQRQPTESSARPVQVVQPLARTELD